MCDLPILSVTSPQGGLLWLGPSPREPFVTALEAAELPTGKQRTVRIPGHALPFRVVRHAANGTDLYLGLSDVHAVHLLDTFLARLALIWLGAVGAAWIITFASARRMLARVKSITTAAAAIRSDDLSTRIPGGGGSGRDRLFCSNRQPHD